jgi:hypothetical protein
MSKMRLSGPTSVVEAEVRRCDVLRALRERPELLQAVAQSNEPELALQRVLRNQYADELVRGAIELHEVRQRAARKFSHAAQMWLDRVGLEQATSEPVARHKAARFTGEVDDLGCGIGGDTLALAAQCQVRACDLRPSACLMTAWNAEVYEVGHHVETDVVDVVEHPGDAPLVHIDPDRRAQGPRAVRIENYEPGLDFLHRQLETRTGGAIKVSPASNFGGKFPDCEIELVSVQGECKEAIVWFGSLSRGVSSRATLLPSGATVAADPLSVRVDERPPGAFVYDPDPAVVRAGLVDTVADQLGLGRLDADEEYLTGDARVMSEFVRSFEVLAVLPHNLRRVAQFFRQRPFGEVAIKCRHVPTDAETWRRKLPLEGSEPAVLIIARIGGRTHAIVCRRS